MDCISMAASDSREHCLCNLISFFSWALSKVYSNWVNFKKLSWRKRMGDEGRSANAAFRSEKERLKDFIVRHLRFHLLMVFNYHICSAGMGHPHLHIWISISEVDSFKPKPNPIWQHIEPLLSIENSICLRSTYPSHRHIDYFPTAVCSHVPGGPGFQRSFIVIIVDAKLLLLVLQIVSTFISKNADDLFITGAEQ